MVTSPKCDTCGTDLPADAPQGLCPKCLLQQGMRISILSRETLPSIIASPVIRYFGDYEIEREIARGGMGAVFKAWQLKLNRPVAVKMILEGRLADEQAVKRFYTEAEAAANLQHPNIVAIHEIGSHEGQHYFSMDYVEGQNLSELANGKPLPPARAAQYVSTIAQAIHYAHQRGTLHRDLKPSNILIDQLGNPRITDFGLAKLVNGNRNVTVSGAVLGTPSYMAPEQAMGRQDLVGPQTDVYSLGAILYELLTSRPPFLGQPMATVRAVIDSDPIAPRRVNHDVPIDLEVICLKCLEKLPNRRYSSARELAEELDRYLKGQPILARPASAMRKTANWLRRHPGQLAALAAMAMFALAVFVFYLTEQNGFLRAQIANPGLARSPGPRSESLSFWKQINSAALFLGFCAWIWYVYRSRRGNWRTLFETDLPYRAIQSVGQKVRGVMTGVGLLNLVAGVMLLARIIQVLVWENPALRFGLTVDAYMGGWLGLLLPWQAWQDYRGSTMGAARRDLPAPATEEIRRAVLDFDVAGALRIYRREAPDASAVEAQNHVARLFQELGVKPPKFTLATMNWPGVAVAAGVMVLIAASLWMVNPPPRPLPTIGTFAAGAYLGLTVAALKRINGFSWRMLVMLPPLLMTYIAGAMSGSASTPMGPSYFFGLACGIILMACALRPASRSIARAQ